MDKLGSLLILIIRLIIFRYLYTHILYFVCSSLCDCPSLCDYSQTKQYAPTMMSYDHQPSRPCLCEIVGRESRIIHHVTYESLGTLQDLYCVEMLKYVSSVSCRVFTLLCGWWLVLRAVKKSVCPVSASLFLPPSL